MGVESGDERIVGIDLAGTRAFGGLVDGAGRIEHETHAAQSAGGDGERAFHVVAELAEALVARARADGHVVRAVGVGAPGITRRDGVVVSAVTMGWREMPLAQRLQERLGLPTRVENDVNLAALGELRHGAGRGMSSLVCLAVGTGIGGAVIIDGKLHRGHRDAAGEIGAFLPGPDFLGWRNAEWGALESIASGAGIAVRARALAEFAGVATPRDDIRADEVLVAAAEGALWANAIYEETIDYLAVAVANIQALLDPQRIVLGGGITTAAEQMIPEIIRRLEDALPSAPEIVPSALGPRAGVLGAPVLFA